MSIERLFAVLTILFLGGAGSAPGRASAEQLLWQTNSYGDDIHVIDVDKRETVERLVVGPNPHGIATDRNQTIVYVSVERNDQPTGELLWIDPVSFAIEHRLPVGPQPHQLAVTPDGRFAYVPCRDGHYWVIDTRLRKVVTRIHTGGRPHNTTASPDGRFMYLSPMGSSHSVTVVDVGSSHRVVGAIPFEDSTRPPALSGDGETLFQHVDGLNGFQAASVVGRMVVATVEHSRGLGFIPLGGVGWLGWAGLQRCHGLGIRPDQREIWSVCGAGITVHDLASPSYPELAHIPLEEKGYWLTFSPDSRWCFVALSDAGRVAMIDVQNREVVAHFDVGRGPKRNLVIEMN